jgi:hypothetical protein
VTLPKIHILSGSADLTKQWLDGQRDDFENLPLREMFECIQHNFKPSKPLDKLSRQNWRLVGQPHLGRTNSSSEKILEKRIAHLLAPRWVNQVPAASGYCGSGDRKRSIDLISQIGDSAFIFYELKVHPDSGDVVAATIELLGYGLLYIFSRVELREYVASPLMKAQTVHLRLLATWDYYQKQTGRPRGPSQKFQDTVSFNISRFATDSLTDCKIDFGLDTFPEWYACSHADREDDARILAAVEGIHPWFS